MNKRLPVRARDLKPTLDFLQKRGLAPTALDTMPDGTIRWHFTPTIQTEQDALDKELAEFEARHGHGRT